MKMNRNKIEKDTNAYHYNAAYIESEGETLVSVNMKSNVIK